MAIRSIACSTFAASASARGWRRSRPERRHSRRRQSCHPQYKWKVIGIPDGFDGLIWPERAFELTLKSVSGILPRGGTILGTTNRGNPFNYKTTENGQESVRASHDEVIANATKLAWMPLSPWGGEWIAEDCPGTLPQGNEDRGRA